MGTFINKPQCVGILPYGAHSNPVRDQITHSRCYTPGPGVTISDGLATPTEKIGYKPQGVTCYTNLLRT